MENEFVDVTEKLFVRWLKGVERHDEFIAQGEFEDRFPEVITAMKKGRRRNTGIVMEPLASLAKTAVRLTAKEHGVEVISFEELSEKMEYLGCNHGGHYSVDYYRILRYSLVRLRCK